MIRNRDGFPIYLVGLTGSIASGKTKISDFLREKGAFVLCADEVSREVSAPGGAGYASLIETFGKDYLRGDGTLDRRKLAEHVFHDPQALARLNALLHPVIQHAIVQQLEQSSARAAVVSAPLLIEAGWTDWLDEVWLVEAGDEQRLQRLMEREKISRQEAEARMRAQMPQQEKEKYADAILDNSGALEDTLRRAAALWERVKH